MVAPFTDQAKAISQRVSLCELWGISNETDNNIIPISVFTTL